MFFFFNLAKTLKYCRLVRCHLERCLYLRCSLSITHNGSHYWLCNVLNTLCLMVISSFFFIYKIILNPFCHLFIPHNFVIIIIMPFLSFLAWKTVQVRFIRILQHHIRSSRLIQMDKSCLDSHHINGSIQKPHQIHVNNKSTFRPNE